MSDTKVNTLDLMRQEIRNGEWSDMDLHYVVCQLVATYAEYAVIGPDEVGDLVEGMKDDLDEADYWWLGENGEDEA